MKTKRFFLFGLPTVLLALGLVLAGCDTGGGGDSSSGNPVPVTLATFVGTYTGTFNSNGTMLMVTASSLTINGTVPPTIYGVTISEGGSNAIVSWYYLIDADNKKIGIATIHNAEGTKSIYLGGDAVNNNASALGISPTGIITSTIRGMGTKN
ncbi:MAG: hypothetical protein LBK61_02195 [Spirochaetaceae bacterium]|jgi:hypothetical protein|nr:hypothetical protein [Spirochaetaceae bacterium]